MRKRRTVERAPISIRSILRLGVGTAVPSRQALARKLVSHLFAPEIPVLQEVLIYPLIDFWLQVMAFSGPDRLRALVGTVLPSTHFGNDLSRIQEWCNWAYVESLRLVR
jgi:hypothetical protein